MIQAPPSALGGGFTDAPIQSARGFRALMQALARPGRIETLDGAAPPAPMSPAAGVLALVLCDAATPVHLAGAHDTPALRDWLRFHTGAPLVGPAEAAFAFGTWEALGPLDRYRAGTPDYPDRSATLVVERPELGPHSVRLRGPGIKDHALLNLPPIAQILANQARFPLGVDLFLTAGHQVAGLPRTTRPEDL